MVSQKGRCPHHTVHTYIHCIMITTVNIFRLLPIRTGLWSTTPWPNGQTMTGCLHAFGSGSTSGCRTINTMCFSRRHSQRCSYDKGRGERNPGPGVIPCGSHYLINSTTYPQHILNNVYWVALQ